VKFALLLDLGLVGAVTGPVGLGDLQLGHDGRRDLGDCSEPIAFGIVAVEHPVIVGRYGVVGSPDHLRMCGIGAEIVQALHDQQSDEDHPPPRLLDQRRVAARGRRETSYHPGHQQVNAEQGLGQQPRHQIPWIEAAFCERPDDSVEPDRP
jgi:hypothetical protein